MWEEPKEANMEHAPGVWEVRSIDIKGSSNQCVYDSNGRIMDKIEMINGEMSFAPGSADFRSCPIPILCSGHTKHDYLPWIRAKRLDKAASTSSVESFKYRKMYYEVRPIMVEH